MSLPAGTRLGPYEILHVLGAGGMGEVYAARDTRLDRRVALKTVRPELTGDHAARERFTREARAISALNHPHIAVLHDVGTEGATPYLVMEFVEGETLADRLKRGALPLAEALTIAGQIADALDVAHRQGIVHRDLKPGNVMLVRRSGAGSPTAKLLDFGLARTLQASATESALSETVVPITGQGMFVGTLQYMAPEQLEGKDPDTRSDLWAFGCLLYEMLSGQPAFPGANPASLVSSIMTAQPRPLGELVPLSPPELHRIVGRALAKHPDERWQTARDLRLELQWLNDHPFQPEASPVTMPASRAPGRWAMVARWAMGLTLMALAAAGGWLWTSSQAAPLPMSVRMSVEPPPGYDMFKGTVTQTAVSPDGRRVVFQVLRHGGELHSLALRDFSQPTAVPLAGTEGAYAPFWSADSLQVAYTNVGRVMRLAVGGGMPQPISDLRDVPSVPGTWTPEGDVLIEGPEGIRRISSAGRPPQLVTHVDSASGESRHSYPWLLPDGERFLFLSQGAQELEWKVWAARLDRPGQRTLITVSDARVAFIAPNILVLVRQGRLLGQPLDRSTLQPAGEPTVISDSVTFNTGGNGQAGFGASSHGTIVFRPDPEPQGRLVWFDLDGRRTATAGERGSFLHFRLSPDGTRLLFSRRVAAGSDLWLQEMATGSTTRLTFDPNRQADSACWVTNDRIAFTTRTPSLQVTVRNLAGGGDVQVNLSSPPGIQLSAQSRIHVCDAERAWVDDNSFLVLRLQQPWGLEPLLSKGIAQRFPSPSGDGRFLAYVSYEGGGVPHIYVQTVPIGGGKWQVSRTPGGQPAWSRDGRELYWVDASNTMMAAQVTTGDQLVIGPPRELFKLRQDVSGSSDFVGFATGFAVAPDGRFLTLVADDQRETERLSAILNWRP